MLRVLGHPLAFLGMLIGFLVAVSRRLSHKLIE